ncbi:MAG: snare associated Golgi protein-domain-containing protein [Monoraphidium minutum]|nr:MAG: snare associated Golgi protein-domain-containing protein [Monoraphidium minutum]
MNCHRSVASPPSGSNGAVQQTGTLRRILSPWPAARRAAGLAGAAARRARAAARAHQQRASSAPMARPAGRGEADAQRERLLARAGGGDEGARAVAPASPGADGGGDSGGGGGGGGGSGGGGRVAVGLGLVGAAVLLLVVLRANGYDVQGAVKDLEDLISRSGYLGPLIFVGAYAGATVLLFPASLLTLGAGYLFGPLAGTALVSLASTTGATLAFLVSRYLARPLVEERLRAYPKFGAVDAAISREGAKVVLLLRLSPLFPFNLLNYFLGVTQISLLPYVAASWLGMLPGTFAYVFLGSAGKEAGEAAAGGGAGGAKWALYVVGAVATVLVTRVVSQAAARALQESGAEGGGGGGGGGGGEQE